MYKMYKLDIQNVPPQNKQPCLIEYYMVETQGPGFPVYGIRIHFLSGSSICSPIYVEEISNLSTSRYEVYQLLCLCSRYQVTPTDLFSALDLLISHEQE